MHIGTGNNLEPFEYILEKGMFHRLSQQKAFTLAVEKHPDFAERFDTWLDENTKALENEKRNIEQNRIRARFNLRDFARNELKDPDLAASIVNSGTMYSFPAKFGFTVTRQVSECIKTPLAKGYIPGSSIKGFIRTALLFAALKRMEPSKAAALIHKCRHTDHWNNPSRKGRLDEQLLNEVFVCGSPGEHKRRSDSLADLMKFIRVSDTELIDGGLVVVPAGMFLTDKLPQRQVNPQEALDRGSVLSFSLTVNSTEIMTIYKARHKAWTGLQQKFRLVFDIDLASVNPAELEEKLNQSILQAVTAFSSAILQAERDWLARYRHTVMVKSRDGDEKKPNADISVIRSFYSSLPDGKCLARIGWGSGFMATTVFAYLSGTEELKTFALELLHHFGIGVPYTMKHDATKQVKSLDRFPKSKRLASRSESRPVYPFGWVVILPSDESFDLPSIDENLEAAPYLGSAPQKPEVKKLTEEEYISQYTGKKHTSGAIIVAKYLGSQGRRVAVLLCDNDYRSDKYYKDYFTISYGDVEVLKKEQLFYVKVKEIKGNKITAVDFSGLIR